jgi:hypothetical protein
MGSFPKSGIEMSGFRRSDSESFFFPWGHQNGKLELRVDTSEGVANKFFCRAEGHEEREAKNDTKFPTGPTTMVY